MAVCGNRIQDEVCSQTASGSQLPIYYSHTCAHSHIHTHTHIDTHRYTHCLFVDSLFATLVVKSPALLSFFLLFFGGFFCTCISVSLCVFICLCLSPRTPITPLKSMNCSICPGKQAENKY